MFFCSACAKRASNAILHQLHTKSNAFTIPSRAIGTASGRQQNHGSASVRVRDATEARGLPDRNSNRARRAVTSPKIQRASKKELEWIDDPWHLADAVRKRLRNGNFEKALIMVREASAGDQVVVSWNHLIEHLFKEQKLHAAIKLFNEMKKRAQLPNAQTFTIIFSGLAESKHPKLAVAEALKIYNAMRSNPRLKPNVTHLNAVLDVCAKAQDIESLFVTLQTADEDRSPDNLTYTIVLNALRHQETNTPDPNTTLSEEQEAAAVWKSKKQTVARAKLVWEEVMSRWRKSEIVMDEELMCAMGRILLMTGPKETETILAMVTEILGIERLKDGQPGLMPNPEKRVDITKKPGDSRKVDKQQDVDSTNPSIKLPPTPRKPIVQPTVEHFAANNTLSLLMRALANSKLTRLGARYWDYMTTIYSVKPDRKNYRDYLDCLFTGAASGKAARVIDAMPAEIAEAQAIRRGLLMCFFDTESPKAFDNANAMLDAMTRKLRYPDPRCMKVYLDVALKARAQFSNAQTYPTREERDAGYGLQLFTAVERIMEPLRLATNHLGLDDRRFAPREKTLLTYPERRALITTAETAQGVCDKILSQQLLPVRSQEHKLTVARREIFNKCAVRWHQLAERSDRVKAV